MKDLTVRIQYLVDELASVQRELNEQLLRSAQSDPITGLHVEPSEGDAVRNLKCVVDQVRHFLWFYLQATSRGSEGSEKTLQLLRQMAHNAGSLATTSPLSFLERLNALSEYALVHYQASDDERPN